MGENSHMGHDKWLIGPQRPDAERAVQKFFR